MSLSLNARNFNVSKVILEQGQAKQNRIPPVNMKYGENDKSRQYFQLLLPLSTINLLVREDPEGKKEPSYTLTYSLANCDVYARERSTDNSEIGTLYNSLLDLEEKVKKTMCKNQEWLSTDEDYSEEMIQKLFKRTIHVAQEKLKNGKRAASGKYPPSVWIKVPVYDGKVSIDKEGIIDNKGHPVKNVTPENLENIFPKYSQARLVITGRIYVMNGGAYGITWTLKGAQVMPTNRVKAIELFSDTIEEDDDNREHDTTEQSMSQPMEEQAVEERPVEKHPVEEQPVEEQPQVNVPAPSRKKRSAVNQ